MNCSPNVFSPIANGNGAHVVHSILAEKIPGYELYSLSPKLATFPQLLKIKRKKADIVHTIPEYGSVFFNESALNVVTFHNYFWDKDYQQFCTPAQRIYYRLFQFQQVCRAVKYADALTSVSQSTAALVSKQFPGKRIEIIRNGVDLERFSPGNRSRTKRKTNTVRILFSGNLSRRKGSHSLIPIANELPERAELIVTSGLRGGTAIRHHPRIRYIDRISYGKMPELYRECDILLLPSYREGLSLSVLEAMACGLAVISFNASSMNELIIHGEGGYLGTPYQIRSLSDCLIKLVNSPDTIREMGDFNRSRVEESFGLQRMIGSYESLFGQLGAKSTTL